MSDQTPAQLADAAAEAVRALNHATLQRSSNGWQYPGDAYSTVADLALMASRLPQALGQLEGFISELADTGRLQSDHGPDDLAGRLVDFHGALSDAIRTSHAMYAALDRAHQALGAVAYRDGDAGVAGPPDQ